MIDWRYEWIAFDTETTGVGKDARIVSLAVCLFQRSQLVSTYLEHFNPGAIDWGSRSVREAQRIHGLTPSFLRARSTLATRWPSVLRAFGLASVWVGHNASFDLRMLRQERARWDDATGESSDTRVPKALVLDTIGLDCALKPDAGSRKLGMVCARWGVTLADAHKADADAIACGSVLAAMAPLLPQDAGEVLRMMNVAQVAWHRERGRKK